jgi:hypothetical protein
MIDYLGNIRTNFVVSALVMQKNGQTADGLGAEMIPNSAATGALGSGQIENASRGEPPSRPRYS